MSHQKKMDITTHKITFESVVDQNNPAIEWIQFIFHEKIANSMYEHYICFMNIDIGIESEKEFIIIQTNMLIKFLE